MTRFNPKVDWAVFGKVALIISVAALFGGSFLYLSKSIPDAGNSKVELKASGKEFDRRLAEGVYAVQPWSGQTIAFRACRVTKPKMGGFRLGAFNVLEIDDFEITLPGNPAEFANGDGSAAANATDPVRQGLNAEKLSAMAGLDQRVSILKVSGFRLLMIDDNQQRILVVTAQFAKSSGETTISLENCELLNEQLERIRVSKAKLLLGDTIAIEASGQQINLHNLAAIIKNKKE
jgi:hypothetical protein